MNIRFANEKDVSIILDLIKQLAEYEKMSDEVVATAEALHEALFVKKVAEVIIAEEAETVVGFALFFHNFSTFVGKAGLYLEDLFVLPQHRGKGYGKALFLELSNIALQRNCGRMEWAVLDWNTPAINFYKSLGAKAMDEWTVFRLTESEMQKLHEK